MTVFYLLGQNPVVDQLRGLRGGLNSRETVGADLNLFFWLMMVLAAFLATLLVVSRRRQRRALNLATANPARFFGKALRRLGVGTKDKLLMEWLSRRAGIAHPAAMLLHPEVFRSYSARIAGSIHSRPLRDYAASRLAMIQSLAFEDVGDSKTA